MGYFQFLGTGRGQPDAHATGRNRRCRSSAVIQHIATYMLLDATEAFDEQIEEAVSVTAVALTSAHATATAGLRALDAWTDHPIPVCVPKEVWKATVARWGPFDRLFHEPLKPHESLSVGDLEVTCFPLAATTGRHSYARYGYRTLSRRKHVCYASDIGDLPEDAAPYLKDNDLLVIGGTGWDKDTSDHRGALNHIHPYVGMGNERVLITQIGANAPPHAQACTMVRRLSHQADVAYDYLKMPLGR